MTDQKLSEEIKGILSSAFEYGEDQFKIVESNPKQYEIVNALPILYAKKMVATCVERENCGCHKVGDRYVFNATGFLIKDETCDMPCLWAMSSFYPLSLMLLERTASGLPPNGLHQEYVACPDTGCKCGGVGKALFKITIENAPTTT